MALPLRLACIVVAGALLPCLAIAQVPGEWRRWSLPGAEPLPDGARLRLGSGGVLAQLGAEAALSPDGRFVGVADAKACKIFERSSGKEITRLPGAKDMFGRPVLGFAPRGRVMVYGSAQRLRVVEIPGGKTLQSIDVAGDGFGLNELAFSADGRFMALRGFDSKAVTDLHVWELVTAKTWGPFKVLPYQVRMVTALSPDGTVLATSGDPDADKAQAIQLWDVATARELRRLQFELSQERVQELAFAPDGEALAVASTPGGLQLIDVASGELRRRFAGRQGAAGLLSFSPDGKLLIVVSRRGEAQAWHVSDGTRRDFPSSPAAQPLAITFQAGGQILILGAQGSTLTWWDADSGNFFMPHAGHNSVVREIAFAPRGDRLTTLSSESDVITWDTVTGAVLGRLNIADKADTAHSTPMQRLEDLALSPDARLAAASDAHRKGSIRLWDLHAGKSVRELKAGNLGMGTRLAFTSQGEKIVASSVKGTIIGWDTATGKELGRFQLDIKGPASSPCATALSPDGTRLARSILEFDRTLPQFSRHCFMLDLPTSKKLYSLPSGRTDFQSLAFSPDGKLLAGGPRVVVPARNEHLVQLFETATGREVKRLGTLDLPGATTAIAFAPMADSALASSPLPGVGDAAGTAPAIGLWELGSGGLRRLFHGHRERVDALAFSPDGATLASGSADTTVLLWDTSGRPKSPAVLSVEDVDKAWADLADRDAAAAYRTMGRLLGAPAQAVGLLKRQLRPAPRPDVDEASIPRWLTDLDRPEFAARDAATRALVALGRRAEPALKKAQAMTTNLEFRRRVEGLLERLQKQSLGLREVRALEILERAGGREAEALLAELAHGDEAALLTEEAQCVLGRLRTLSALP